jgi:hypothetical protein
VDGWPLGDSIPCGFQALTPDANAVVTDAFKTRFGDAAISDHRCYFPGPYAVDGHPVSWEATPGGVEIHVFTFTDGSRHAVTIGCPGLGTFHPAQPPGPGPKCLVMQLP